MDAHSKELISVIQKEISDSEVVACLQRQRDMVVDLASEWYEKGCGTNVKVDI